MPAYEPGICEISLWRGYVRSEFVAVIADGDEAYELARSRSFRFRGGEVPPEEDERVHAAFAELLETIAEHGWEPVGGGRPWYAYRFRRPVQDVHALPLPVTAREFLDERQGAEAAGEPTA